MVESLVFFSFQSYNKCFSFWSNVIQSRPVHLQSITKTLCSCIVLRFLLSLEKEIIVLEKNWKKS